MQVEEILEKLMEYYEVHTISDLSKILEIGQPAISKWKTNNSINTIKKKCRELGIYDEIFGGIQKENIEKDNQLKTDNANLCAQNVNSKLFLFPRRSLVYLYYLITNESINNSVDYFSWMEKKDRTNSIMNFISDFVMEGNRLSLSSYRSELDRYLDYFITIDELDYIFGNRTTFTRSVKFMIDEK